MGVVYRAREIAFDRDVAVKLLQERFAADSPAARRFLGEARITGQLQHPAIPPVHHLGTLPDGRPFLAMKLIRGETLADLLARAPASGAPGAPTFVPVFAQVCHAVAYAHSRKVIHRDLKPANVMVGAFGEVQVMDWGLAKVLGPSPRTEPARPGHGPGPGDGPEPEATADQSPTTQGEGSQDLTVAGQSMGTPSYMPPEQACGDLDRIDCRSDVFALGGVLCAILTGRPPYTGLGGAEVMRKALAADLGEALARLDSCGADAALAALCKRCLAAECEARPRDAAAVAEEVMAHLAAAEERARQAELERVRGEEQRKRRRVQRTLAGAVIGLLVAAGFGVALASLWQRAEGAKAGAETARDDEALARREKERANQQLAQVLYLNRVRTALGFWRDAEVVAAGEQLRECPRALRGWEFGYALRLTRPVRTASEPDGGAYNVAFTPDGRWIVGGSEAYRVRDGASGRELFALEGTVRAPGPSGKANFNPRRVAVSPDGRRIAVTLGAAEIGLWDAGNGKRLATLNRPVFGAAEVPVGCVAFSADGKRLALGCGGTNTPFFDVLIWDAATDRQLTRLKGHTRPVRAAAWSGDGRLLASAAEDGTVRLWEAHSLKGRHELTGAAGPLLAVVFTPDGTRLAAGGTDGRVRVWDARTGRLVYALEGRGGNVLALAFSPNGKRLAAGLANGTVPVWDVESGTLAFTLRGSGEASSLAWSPEGSRLAVGGKTAWLYDASGPQEHHTVVWPPDGGVLVGLSPDGRRGLRMVDGQYQVWDVDGPRRLTSWRPPGQPPFYHLIGPRGRVATWNADGRLRVWDGNGAAERLVLSRGTTERLPLAFSPDGSRLAGTGKGELVVWDTRAEGEPRIIPTPDVLIQAAAFSPDGHLLAAARGDGRVDVWDATAGTLRHQLPGTSAGSGTAQAPALAFSPDGTLLATGQVGPRPDSPVPVHNGFAVWSVESGHKVLSVPMPWAHVTGLAFSPDGKRLASVEPGAPGFVRLWDVQTGQEALAFRGSWEWVRFSPDGRRLTAAGFPWGEASPLTTWEALPPGAWD
jgi:WD40 repeat protein